MKNTYDFHVVTNKLRSFFLNKGYIEVPAQARTSILAACEDPDTISSYSMTGVEWPLPQTGQMWLERELLQNPHWKGVFCSTTSYRDEPNPIPGRHDRIFPMFEFEQFGSFEDLKKLEMEILEYMGFGKPEILDYEELCQKYQTKTLEAEHEARMCNEINPAVILQKFPQRTHPFWNMKYNGNGLYNKVDVILYGMETIGSAERSCNPDEMLKFFHSVSDGQYKQILFEKFGEKRVMAELEEYLSLDFKPRFGAGMGVTRMARAMHKAGLLQENDMSFVGAFKTSVDQLGL